MKECRLQCRSLLTLFFVCVVSAQIFSGCGKSVFGNGEPRNRGKADGAVSAGSPFPSQSPDSSKAQQDSLSSVSDLSKAQNNGSSNMSQGSGNSGYSGNNTDSQMMDGSGGTSGSQNNTMGGPIVVDEMGNPITKSQVCPNTAGCVLLQGSPIQFWNDRSKINDNGVRVPDNFPLGQVENFSNNTGKIKLDLVSDVKRRASVAIELGANAKPIVSMQEGFRTNMCYDHSRPKCELVNSLPLGGPSASEVNCSSHIRYVFQGQSTILGESTCRRCVIRGGIGNSIADFRADSREHCASECQKFADTNPNRVCKHLQDYQTVFIKERAKGTCRIEGDAGVAIYEKAGVDKGHCYWSCKGEAAAVAQLGATVLDEEFPDRFKYSGDIVRERPNRRCKFDGSVFCEGAETCNNLNWLAK